MQRFVYHLLHKDAKQSCLFYLADALMGAQFALHFLHGLCSNRAHSLYSLSFAHFISHRRLSSWRWILSELCGSFSNLSVTVCARFYCKFSNTKFSVQSHVNRIQWTIVIFQFVTFVYIFSQQRREEKKTSGFCFVLFRVVLCIKRTAFFSFHVVWCEHLRNDIVNRATGSDVAKHD